MFEDLSSKFDKVFKFIKGKGKVSEATIDEFLREVRRIMLDADVNYKVVKQFVDDVKAKALEKNVIRSINPGKIVIDTITAELVRLMGEKKTDIKFSNDVPSVIMMVGLQGSGKTTFSGKLAKYLKSRGKNPALAACDVYRPAAIDQLKTLGEQIDVAVYSDESKDPVKIAMAAVEFCKQNYKDTLIVDTAGRLAIDEEMMREVETLKSKLNPAEILFVVDSMTGQDAVNTAKEFHDRLNFDGVILTKLDGDSRGGAALSIRAVVDKPVKFVGVGEKLDAIEPFYPDRMASRILGKGDIQSLVEKAATMLPEELDEKKIAKLEEKFRGNKFDFGDFLDQLQQIKKMGSLSSLMGMIPGVDRIMKGKEIDDKPLRQVEAVINSMTLTERTNPDIINGARRKRIATGSGTSIQDVNRVIKQFYDMQKMIKTFKKGRGMNNVLRNMGLPPNFSLK
ncbi:MAG TPA: signal recognition particle protein [Ignavibacteria bacterium]|nr:signal recognition particle protein [Ignavibacteria bacterium]HRF66931.1 signal recognition particle protein [Ignavibacteria bacterium]HRJ05710.1 signal recognition particle protein [Ignavibacteria bacterium]